MRQVVDVGDGDWAWIRRYASWGLCVTAVAGRTDREMLDGFGVAEDSIGSLTMAEADTELGTEFPVIRAGHLDGWGFAFESFGSAGSDPAAVTELSAGTRAVSVWYLASALGRFSYLEDGVLVCGFEPLFPARREGSEPDRFVARMRRVGLPPDATPDLSRVDPVVAALELATDVTGFRLPAGLVEGPLLTGAIEPDTSWLDE